MKTKTEVEKHLEQDYKDLAHRPNDLNLGWVRALEWVMDQERTVMFVLTMTVVIADEMDDKEKVK